MVRAIRASAARRRSKLYLEHEWKFVAQFEQ
jgi:hypothetical protein